MKGLIFVLLMLGLLLISVPETHGQPFPDGGMVSDQETEDIIVGIIVFLSVLDWDDGVGGTSIFSNFIGNMCPK